MAKVLYLSKQGCPDIQTDVPFLTTRVKAPDLDDWKKLTRLFPYLKCSMLLVLDLTADDLGIAQWWLDAAYNVHPDLKGHSGATKSM